jgi:hypothetical protein
MGDRKEINDVHQGKDKSKFGKPYVARPTAKEVAEGAPGVAKVIPEYLPAKTETSQATREYKPGDGMFKGEHIGTGVTDPDTGRG